MIIGNKSFEIGNRTYIMGILNMTPDSFSDGGQHNSIDEALRHAAEMVEEGADIIDVGGESTRPGYAQISVREEISRVAGVIKAICSTLDVPVSIDTYKPEVAREAIRAGASMINDIWGFQKYPDMAAVAAEYNVACCLMHNSEKAEYVDIISGIESFLTKSVEIAIKSGIDKSKIILDPGIGFGKTYEHNLDTLRKLQNLKKLDFPILLGTSRKSVVGNALKLPVEQRLEGTLATTVIGIEKGVDFIRVHDVKENKRACMMADIIYRHRGL